MRLCLSAQRQLDVGLTKGWWSLFILRCAPSDGLEAVEIPAFGPVLTNLLWSTEWLQGRVSAAPPGPGEEAVPSFTSKTVQTNRDNKMRS